MERQVLAIGTRAVLALCDRAGIQRDELLAQAGLPGSVIDTATGWISLDAVEALWIEAGRLLQDPHVGLHAAMAIPWGAYGVVDHLAANAPTFGEGVARLDRYFRLVARAILLDIRALPEGGHRVELAVARAGERVFVQYAEFVFGVIVTRFRQVTAVPCLPYEVRFAGPCPGVPDEVQRVLGGRALYDQRRHEMLFSAATWAEPVLGFDSTLSEVLERHASDLLGRMPDTTDVVRKVHKAVAAALRQGEPTLQAVAARLDSSVRTLQRRLAVEGVTFRAVVDQVRQELAQGLLADGNLTIAELAYLLGYSEPSAFHRAYKRWTGTTPEAYRKALR